MITVDIDTQKLERANQIHWQLVDAKSSFLASRGFEPHEHAQIDLLAEYKNDSVFYEMKSIHSEGENLLPQIRKAIAQLYEYRYIFGQPTARLCIVTNQSIASKNNWLLEYLEKDRSIAYEWTDDFLNFNSHSDSKLLTGNFSP